LIDPQTTYFIAFLLLSSGIGLGLVTSRAIKKLMPKRKIVGGIFGVFILFLSISQAIHRINMLTNDENSNFLFTVQNIDELANSVYELIPQDFFGWIAVSIIVIFPALTWAAKIEKAYRGAATLVSIIGLMLIGLVTFGVEFTDGMILWFISYQIGIPIGVLFGSGSFKFIKKLVSQMSFPKLSFP